MNKFFEETNDDLRILCLNTSESLGLSEAVIEKDYWVCFVLNYLFHKSKWKDAFTFKGGTSLSKCFKLIERFSEDIDLILDWRVLGYAKDEPWEERSNTGQDKFNKKINIKTEEFLKTEFLPEIEADFRKLLKSELKFSIDKKNPQTILFEYPKIFSSSYLTQNIRLEIGSLAAWTPAIKVKIEPMISEVYPNTLKEKIEIRTVAPERTFWEKATILHHEANRPKSSGMPRRYARHYYDLYKMESSPVKESAIRDIELMKKVTNFKIKFYPRKWAKYEDVLEGKIRLLPDEYRFTKIQEDYDAMKEMMYGDYPAFDEMLKELKNLEKELNKNL